MTLIGNINLRTVAVETATQTCTFSQFIIVLYYVFIHF